MTLERAFALAGVESTRDLHRVYDEADQPLMRNFTWDYDNPDLLINQIKNELEEVDLGSLKEDDRDWCREILWFWHHHAISCALRKKDREAARHHAATALRYQDEGHPNQITRLLFYLAHHRLEDAKRWAETINDEVERETAASLLEWYEQGYFP